MLTPDPNTIALSLYRLASMVVGLALVYMMGCRLFLVVYALLGAIVILAFVPQGFSVTGSGTDGFRTQALGGREWLAVASPGRADAGYRSQGRERQVDPAAAARQLPDVV